LAFAANSAVLAFFDRGFYPCYGFGPYCGLGTPITCPSATVTTIRPGYYPHNYGYATYQPYPNVTVVYPPLSDTGSSVTRLYDQYGQEARPNASPLYPIAFNDRAIRAALFYRVDGNTLHYVTVYHERKEAPLNTVDRALSMQLNRERRVPFQLP
jgi:hypothetical protein